MADPDGIQITEFGGRNEDPRYMDSNSARGIGFREGYTMVPEQDVALNSQSRARFNIHPYDPSKPWTADQWFTYGGKKYHYADNIPEIYSNARIDVFKGTYDIRRGRNVIGWKPGNIDTNQNSTSLLNRFREDNPEFRLYSNEAVLQTMQDRLAPGMDPQQFQTAATSPGGIADIQAYQQSPLYQLRQTFGEEGKGLTDAELLHKVYDHGVGSGQIDSKKESFEEFQERFAPVQTWQAQTGRFVKNVDQIVSEAIRQVLPQTEQFGLELYGGTHQMAANAGLGDLNSVLGTLYPGQDNSARLSEYARLSQDDAEAKLRQDIVAGGPELTERLSAMGTGPESLFEKLDAGLAALKDKKSNQDVTDWANKMVLKVDKENPGNLPENQEKIAKIIAQTPAQVLMNLVPGLRELGNYTQLYKGDYDTIKRDHPDWDEQTIDARAHKAADEQFPAQEILSLLMVKGGPSVRAGLTGMLLNEAKNLALATGVGGLTMSANQVITNVENDKPPLSGVSDAFQTGVVMGGVGRVVAAGSNLSVSFLKRAVWATPQIRKAMGLSGGIVTQDAEGTMRLVNGNGDSPVEKKVELNVLDIAINGVKALTEKTTTEAVTKGAITAAEEGEKESPVIEAFRKAEAAREAGDLGEAQKQIDQALALANPTQRDIINRHVAAQLRAITNTPPPTLAKPEAKQTGALEPEVTVGGKAAPIEWQTLQPFQTKAEIPEGAETRVNPLTGLTEYRVPAPVAPKVSDQPVIDYFGTAKTPKTEVKEPTLEQTEHGFPSGHIQTRPDGQADLYMENGVKLTFPDVEDAIQARGTIRKGRTHKWEARSSGGETISQAELNNGTEVETAVPPKAETQPSTTTVPDYVRAEIDRDYDIAQRLGLVEQIEQGSANRQTAAEIAQGIKVEGYNLNETRRLVRSVRSKLGIPSMDDAAEFEAWLQHRSKPAIATEPLVTYQPELDPQGKPTGRQIAFRDGKRIGIVNPKAPGQTVDPVTPTPPTKLEDQLQQSISQRAQQAKGVAGWKVGDLVNVGFMRNLKVIRRIPTPGDYAPDQWLLRNQKGDHYLFTPHKGIQKIDEGEMEGLGAFYNPFAAMREAKRTIGQFPGWKGLEKGTRELLAPQRLGDVAQDVAAMSIPLNTAAKTNLVARIHEMALHANLNGVFERATESERREAFFNNQTDAQLSQWVVKWATSGKTGNPTADKLMRFNESVIKTFNHLADKSEVTNGFLRDLFTQAFKDPDAAKAWYESQLGTTGKVPDFYDAIAASVNPLLKLELKSYNPERLMLTHAATVLEGIKEIQMLHQMVDEGYAVEQQPVVKIATLRGKPVYQRPIPYGWTGSFQAADGKTYRMAPEAASVVKNMFTPSRLYDSIGQMPGTFFGALKGLLSAKLSWSQFHQVHIGMGIVPAEALTEYLARVGKGLGKPGETVKAVGTALEGYLSVPVSAARMATSFFAKGKYLDPFFEQMIPSARRLGNLIDVMQGKGDPNSLSIADRTNYKELLDMGIVARPSHERFLQWSGWLLKNGALHKADKFGNMGYKFITNAGFQQFYFGRVLPSLKIAAALRKRDTVMRYYDKQGINLRDPANAQIWRGEAAKINRDIEGRFGEFLYDNLLWNKTAKQVGMQATLSLGWGLGFWRVHGDAIQDLTDNALNLDRIANHTYKNPELVTNRMLYAAAYWANTIATSVAVSVLIGGADPNKLKWADMFFPRIGTKPNGDDERIRPPTWSSEFVSLIENATKESGGNLFSFPGALAGGFAEAQQYSFNKLSPAIHTFWQIGQNKDFRGRQIADTNDPFLNQALDMITYGVKDILTPIGIESALTSPRVTTNRAKLAALLGFGPDPSWVNRTAFENTVIYKAEQEHPEGVIGHHQAAYFDARAVYMRALQSKDPQQISDALKAWHEVGVTPRQVENARNEVFKVGHGKINTGLNEWKKLDADSQFHLLEQAPRELFHDYFMHAQKQTRERWIKEHGPLTPEQLATVPAQQ